VSFLFYKFSIQSLHFKNTC